MIQDDAKIEDFIALYQSTEQICIFTGAGVSFTQDKRYRAPGWEKLLNEILCELLGASRQHEAETLFSELKNDLPDLWDLATAIKSYAPDEETFQVAFRKVVLKDNESANSDGVLKARNLNGATTLNAIISFCSEVSEMRAHPCFVINPKIKAILTSNYDPFLEAGGTQKHRSNLLKPMSRPTSTFKPDRQLPVYHIHGYLPFRRKKDKRGQPIQNFPLPTEPLILDRGSYEEAYQTGSWAVGEMDKLLKNYPTLFIGFSFDDEFFLKELTRLVQSPGAPVHYALLRRGDKRPKGLLDKIRHANVRPIFYEEHNEIPFLLRRTYQSALPEKDIRIPTKDGGEKLVDADQYWKMLWFDKRWKEKR